MSATLNTDNLILWFDDLGTGNEKYNFLSNFFEGAPLTFPDLTDVEGEALTFATGEHAFAAMKFFGSDMEHFTRIMNAPDPNTAKALGRSRAHALRPDWEAVKYDAMAAVTRAKYTLNREEGMRLINTGDRLLVEGTYWHDDVWGVRLNQQSEKRPAYGRNWLGTLLMARRAELRAEYAFGAQKHAGVEISNLLANVDYALPYL